MRIRCWLAFSFIGGVLVSASARAEPLAVLYSTSWAGLTAGEIRLGFGVEDGRYHAKLRIETAGLPRWFTRFRALVTSEGRLTEDGDVQPGHYAAHFDLRKRHDRLISFTFTPINGVPEAERDPTDTSGKPELAIGFRRAVLDPLSTLLAIRQHLAEAMPAPGQPFQFPVYDGARRFDVDGTVLPGDGADGIIHLRLVLKPIAGFKGESSQEGDPDSAPRPLELTLTRDTRLIPISMRVSIAFLPFTVHMRRICGDFDSCAAPE